jgi:hypothetical protein
VGQPFLFLRFIAFSLSPDEDPGCPYLKWVLNPKDENQDNYQNRDKEIDVHIV